MNKPCNSLSAQPQLQRRRILSQAALGAGSVALASLLQESAGGAIVQQHAARARRIIYLFMHGGPSQLDLFDSKPGLQAYHGLELPDSVRGNQRLTGMTSGQAS